MGPLGETALGGSGRLTNNGKESGSYYVGYILGNKGIMAKKMETTTYEV